MTRVERKQKKIDDKLRKEQAKIEAKELKKQKKLERKNNSFLKRLKKKIDSLFESTKLTFAGKVFMSSIYSSVISGIGIISVSAIKSVFYLLYAIINTDPTKSCPDLLSGATGLLWLVFIVSCVLVGLFIGLEIGSVYDTGESILEKEEK